MNFVAIDVETANADMASICSIGAVKFENGRVAGEWYSLVDPRDYFAGINISIHGIDERMVRGAPTYAEAARTLHAMLQGAVTVNHTHFDRVATHQASSRWAVSEPDDVLLAETGEIRKLFLGQALSQPDPSDISSHQLAHIHALRSAENTF